MSQFKRLIGRKFSDETVAEEKKRQTCQLVERPGDCIGIKVTYMYFKCTHNSLYELICTFGFLCVCV